jgi:hypothetical protein
MACGRNSDNALLTALVKQGINLILPPRDKVEPGELTIVERDNAMRTGSWREVFGLDVEPQFEKAKSFEVFSFDAKSLMKADSSASALGRIMETFGLGSGKFKGAFDSSYAETIELSLIAPVHRRLKNFDAILNALRQAGAKPTPQDEDRIFCIITDVWRATGLRLRVLDKSGAKVDLSAEAMKELTANAAFSLDRENMGSYTFTAKTPLVFGVTLREIVFANGLIVDRSNKNHKAFRSLPTAADKKFANEDWALVGEDAFVSFQAG